MSPPSRLHASRPPRIARAIGLLVVSSLVGAPLSAWAAPPPLDRAVQVKRFAEAVAKVLPAATVVVDGEAVVVELPGDGPRARANLSPMLDDMEVMATDAERDTRLGRMVRQLVESLKQRDRADDWATAEGALVPIVRPDVSFLTDERMTAPGKPDSKPLRFPRIAWHGPLAIGFALDRPDAVLRVEQGLFDTWAKTESDLLPVAVANLGKLAPRPFTQHAGGFFVADHGDTLDASRLLLVDAIRGLGMRSAPLAIVATRDLLVLAPEGEPEVIQRALAFAAANQRGGRVQHAPVLRLTDAGWEVYAPAAETEVDVALRRWSALAMVHLYAEQKAILDRTVGEDVFVASLEAYEVNGRLLRVVMVTADLPTLLPRADVVTLVRPPLAGGKPEVLGFVDFEVLLKVAGDKAKAQGLSPERWHLEMALTPAELEALAPRRSPL